MGQPRRRCRPSRSPRTPPGCGTRSWTGCPTTSPPRTLVAWSGLFGLVSFELFGQFENVVTDRDAFFDHAAASLGRLAGLSA